MLFIFILNSFPNKVGKIIKTSSTNDKMLMKFSLYEFSLFKSHSKINGTWSFQQVSKTFLYKYDDILKNTWLILV